MALYILTGRWDCSAVNRNLCVKVLMLQLEHLYEIFFVKNLIETNVNISNELNFSEVY